MKNDVFIGSTLVLASSMIAAFSQVLLKKAAGKKYSSRLRSYLNPLVIFAYMLFFATTLFSVTALRFIPLTLSAALAASAQIFVPVMSRFFLRENISRRKWVGMTVIVLGMVIFSI